MVLRCAVSAISIVHVAAFSSYCYAETMWRSSTDNDTVVAAEIEDLYLRLYTAGELTTEPYIDSVGRNVENILRDTQRMAGDVFPIGISSVMCNLNAHVCSKNEYGEPVWTNKSGDTLNIPTFKFDEFTTFITRRKPSGVSTEELLSGSRADCSIFGKICRDAVEILNSHNPNVLERFGEGEIILPERGVQTELTTPTRELPRGQVDEKTIQDVGKVSGFALPDFEDRIISSGNAELQAAYSNEPLYDQQTELFKLLNFDFATLNDLKDIDARFQQPVRIEVLDSWLDATHCEFGNVKVIFASPAPSVLRQPVSCGHQFAAGDLNKALDHAAHVVGLISAQINGAAGGGLNPFAEVVYRQVPLEDFSIPGVRDAVAIAMITDFLNEDTRAQVFNLSWKYRNENGRKDLIRNAIKDTLQASLFVVAAGNNKMEFDDGECGEMPACLTDLPNVVTVIGLDRDPDHPEVWVEGIEGSNVSPNFHVGAIAANVLSASAGNGFVTMSGTSQAAPQVAAAAAYIFSAYKELFPDQGALKPVRVKNRLIYTSDLFSHLLGDVLGGRLNYKRALDIALDNITFSDGGVKRSLRGRLMSIGGEPSTPIICRRRLNGQEISIAGDDLRRMHFDEDRGLYIVFRNSIPGSNDSSVDRIADCQLRTQSQTVRFSSEGTVSELRIDQIIDFVSKL